ncbi:EamA family transporter RarD [Tsuneonella sp. HG222]
MSEAPGKWDRKGLAAALTAHVFWGSMPIYLLTVRSVPALEFLAWRILFGIPFCLALLLWRGSMGEVRAVLRDSKAMRTLLATAMLIGFNWFLYVWAIQTSHVYAASLGYYILPLVMMVLGMLFLGERLNRAQWIAVALAVVGVSFLALGALTTLWLSLSMAVSFGIYGLLRKTVNASPLAGLTVESLILAPFALAVLVWYSSSAQGSALDKGAVQMAWVALGGPLTAVPLTMFAFAARRLPYTVVGFLQFASPTIVFLAGMFVFGEDLKPAQLACFVAIWAAALIFVADAVRGSRTVQVPAPVS